MDYEDRLAKTIDFTSPTGRNFKAFWAGDDRSKQKKVGEFSPPKRVGAIFQDLDVSATKYPLNFLFTGENHDIESNLFFETCSENGVWEIIHPVHGVKKLQLLAVTEKSKPVANANLTEFSTEWVEPLDDDSTLSTDELAGQIEDQLITLNESLAAQLEANSDQTTASRIQALKNTAQSVMDGVTKGLETISEVSADIARLTNSIQRATTTNLANPVIAISSLATQIQLASQAPALATSNVTERLNSYESVSDTISNIEPDGATPESKNTLNIKELTLAALLGTYSRIAITGELKTRQDAIDFAELLSRRFTNTMNVLDLNQDTFENNLLQNQYFSQSQSYSDMIRLVALGIEYLLKASFNLKVEKRFTLDKKRAPIEITISEYGDLGDNDINLDLFIASNNLKNTEILLLPAGKEVVVYV